MPHVLDALDGKHIAIRCARGGVSQYFNVKDFQSIVLLALRDVDVSAFGSSSDGQIFNHCNLRDKIEDGFISFSPAETLVDNGLKVRYFILTDDAFSLTTMVYEDF